jgi:MFS family permease
MLQVGFGLSPIASGTLTFAMSLATLAVRPVMILVLRLFGFKRVLIANGLFTAAMIAAFALVEASTPHWLVFAMVILYGVARSTQFMTTNTLTYSEMPAAQLSRSTSLGGVIQQLTISFGVSIAAALLALVSRGHAAPSVADFHLVFLLMAVVTLVSAPGFLLLHRGAGAQVSGERQGAPRSKPRAAS